MPTHGKTRIKPTVLKKLHGTLNVTRERKRQGEPVPVGALRQTAPPELTAAERDVWRATVRNMPKGVLFRADIEVVKAFCRVAVRVNELQRVLNEARGRPDWGSAVEHRNLDRALLLLARLAGELGLVRRRGHGSMSRCRRGYRPRTTRGRCCGWSAAAIRITRAERRHGEAVSRRLAEGVRRIISPRMHA